MTDAVISYTDDASEIEFRWHGGAYIDVGYVVLGAEIAAGGRFPDRFEAFDVINVWDDAADVSYLEEESADARRPFRATLEAFEERCRQYLADDAEVEA